MQRTDIQQFKCRKCSTLLFTSEQIVNHGLRQVKNVLQPAGPPKFIKVRGGGGNLNYRSNTMSEATNDIASEAKGTVKSCQVCYLSAPGKLVKSEENAIADYVCPNMDCRQLIATHYSDHTCSSCSMFV